jgi:hypothetical protein
MARQVASPARTLSAPRVEWAKYTNGKWWELKNGEDFHQSARSAGRAARQWASNHGYRCSAVTTEAGDLQVQFRKVKIT